MKIVVISPTYNEKANVEKMVPLLFEEVFPKIKNHEVFLLIPDDTSPDGTGEVIKAFMKKWKNLVILEGVKKGLGAAYVKAMHYAMDTMHADAVIEFDADFQHDPQDIPRLIQAMDDGADYVIGSRYIPGGKIPKEWGFDRKIKSIFGSLFARIVLFTFGIHDMTSGFKLTKTSYLQKVDLDHLYSMYYAYKIQILYEVVKLGAKVKEIPIIFYERKEGSSKIERKDLYDSFMVVIKLRIRDSKRLIKFLLVGSSGFVVQVVAQELIIRLGFATIIALFFSFIISFLYPHEDVVTLANAIGAGIGAEAAILSNFMFNNYWTFQDTLRLKERSPFFLRLIKFNITSIAAVIIQFTAVWFGVKFFGPITTFMEISVPTRILIVIPTIILLVIPINYLIYNKIIWKTQHLSDENFTKV